VCLENVSNDLGVEIGTPHHPQLKQSVSAAHSSTLGSSTVWSLGLVGSRNRARERADVCSGMTEVSAGRHQLELAASW
jgi:hypothetical protein